MNTTSFRKKLGRTAAVCCAAAVLSAAPAAAFACSAGPLPGRPCGPAGQHSCSIYSPYCNSSSETVTIPQKEPESESDSALPSSEYTSEVFSLVNSERAANGLAALSYSSAAAAAAQTKAEDMAENGYFSHTSPTYGSAFDLLKANGVTYSSAGENIAKGQTSAASVMDSWMNSSGHRANILSSSYSSTGVGCAADSSGTLYWVQIFIG